jgi:cystathionine beta-lyase
LKVSNIVIPNPHLRAPFEAALQTSSLAYTINLLGMLALQTAYEEGDNWLKQVKDYLTGNLETIAAYLEENTPEIQLVRPEGTHLAWLDCSRLELEPATLAHFFTEQANVYLEEGSLFGEEGSAFMRLNFACPRPILIEALNRIGRAVAHSRTASH